MSTVLRQTHRWTSIAFTLAVVANFVQMGMGVTEVTWVTFSPLPFLFVLLLTGLYLFVLPYVRKNRADKAA